jgi:hypothetical protein
MRNAYHIRCIREAVCSSVPLPLCLCLSSLLCAHQQEPERRRRRVNKLVHHSSCSACVYGSGKHEEEEKSSHRSTHPFHLLPSRPALQAMQADCFLLALPKFYIILTLRNCSMREKVMLRKRRKASPEASNLAQNPLYHIKVLCTTEHSKKSPEEGNRRRGSRSAACTQQV